MKKILIILLIFVLAISIVAVFYFFRTTYTKFYFWKDQLVIPKIKVNTDFDNDGINDQEDILLGARDRIGKTTSYQDGYYQGGYPPENTGVCSDVIWQAFKAAGFNFKKFVDEDIKSNPSKYPGVISNPDPNIDFRRVVNLAVFFERKAQKLTTEIKPWQIDNLQEWQGGDIVIWEKIIGGKMHIAIISDKRRKDGVPLIIHNYGHGVMENDLLLAWPAKIVGHYRYP